MIRTCRLFVFVALGILFARSSATVCAADAAPSEPPKKPVRILFVTQSFGYKHGVVTRKPEQLSTAERAMIDLGIASNLFRVDCSQDVAKDLSKENLQQYDIVMFYTTGTRDKWPVDDPTLDYLCNDWAKQKGHGFVGVHSGADTLGDYKPYWDMLGGTFNGHPWNAKSEVTVVVHDPDHPICKPWGKEFTITDEIYQFKNWQPKKVRVLMSLDISRSKFDAEVKKTIKEPYHIPIAWCKQYGEGKVFHMSLGHNENVWTNPKFMDSMLGGIKWILGSEPGNATPNPELDAAEAARGKADVEAAISARSENQPLEIPLWPNGAPGSEDRKDEKEVKTVNANGEYRIANVHNPSLTVFLPPKDKANGTALVIAPGGGHRQLAFTHEGINEGNWLSERGIAVFVLKYRLAREPGSSYKLPDQPLQDGQRAIRLVRSRATEWGLNPNRVGLMGFSAGGELTAHVCNADGKGPEDAADPVDRQNARPDFQALIYSGPGGIRGQIITKESNLPPTFIAVGDTDNFAPMLASHYLALRSAGVSTALHIYPKTGHGFGLRDSNNGKPSNAWIQRFEEFLDAHGLLKKE